MERIVLVSVQEETSAVLLAGGGAKNAGAVRALRSRAG